MGVVVEALRGLLDDVRSFTIGPIASNDPALTRLFRGRPSATGVSVTEDTALNYSTWWACVRLISSAVAALPFPLYRRLPEGRGRERYREHPLDRLFTEAPNEEMDPLSFRQTMTMYVLTHGNAYAEIERDASFRPVALWLLEPWRVALRREGSRPSLRYRVANATQPDTILSPENVLHLRGLSPDGLEGYSVVRRAREAIGLGLAVEQYGATFFRNGASFGGVLTHPGQMTPDARANFMNSMAERYHGVDKAHGMLLLEEGIKFERTTIPPDDAQFLGTRQYQKGDICAWFNLPPSLVGADQPSGLTYRNSQDEFHRFLILTLLPILESWEQQCNRKLVRPLERKTQYFEHLVDGLLRADTEGRHRSYALSHNKWETTNEIRLKENLPAIEGGDDLPEPAPATPPPAATPAPDPSPRPGAGRRDVVEDAAVFAIVGAWNQMEQTRADIATMLDAIRVQPTPDFTPVMERLDAIRAATEPLLAQLTAVQEHGVALGEAVRDEGEQARLSAVEGLAVMAHKIQGAMATLAEQVDAQAAAVRTDLLDMGTAGRDSVDDAAHRILAGQASVTEEVRAVAGLHVEAMTAAAADQAAVQRQAVEALTAGHDGVQAELQGLREALGSVRADLGGVQTTLADLRAARAEQERLEAVRGKAGPALLAVIRDALRRMVHREALKAKQASQTPEKLRAWMERFYAERGDQETLCMGNLLPAAELHVTLCGRSDGAAEGYVRQVVRASFEESRAALTETLAGVEEAEQLAPAVEALVARWEAERPERLAAAILREEIGHVGP